MECRSHVKRKSSFVQFAKMRFALPQWPVKSLLLASPKQFFYRRIQEYGRNTYLVQHRNIFWLRECAAAQCDDSIIGFRIGKQFAEREMLATAEFCFPCIPEKFLDRPPFARLNSVVKILERPTQEPG